MQQPRHPALRRLFAVDTVIAKGESAILVLALVLMLVLYFLNVVLRNISAAWSLPWLTDLPQQMVLWVTLFGASLAARRGRHINIEVGTQLVPVKARRIVKFLVQLGGVGLSFLLILGSYNHLVSNEIPKTNYVSFGTLNQGFAAGCFCPAGQNRTEDGSCVSVSPDPCKDWVCNEPNKSGCTVVGGKPQCLCDPSFREDSAGMCRGPEPMACQMVPDSEADKVCQCEQGYQPTVGGLACEPAKPLQCTAAACNGGAATVCAEIWSPGTELRVPTWLFALLMPIGFGLMTLHFLIGAIVELVEGFLPGADSDPAMEAAAAAQSETATASENASRTNPTAGGQP